MWKKRNNGATSRLPNIRKTTCHSERPDPPRPRSAAKCGLWNRPPTRPKREGGPVAIVSLDARNGHERAETVLAVPLTTSVHKDVPTHVFLSAGETGLQSDSAARAEDVTVLRKASLVEPGSQLRKLSDTRICELASKVSISMGCLPPLTQVETHFTSRQILLAADERR